MTQTFREERDSLGPVQVPGERLWGAQTQRSLRFFSIGEDRMPKEMIRAYALVKKAAAITNEKRGARRRIVPLIRNSHYGRCSGSGRCLYRARLEKVVDVARFPQKRSGLVLQLDSNLLLR